VTDTTGVTSDINFRVIGIFTAHYLLIEK
jgi:hypothetical protein